MGVPAVTTQLSLIPTAPSAQQLASRTTPPFAVGQVVRYTRFPAVGTIERVQRDTYTGDWWVWFTDTSGWRDEDGEALPGRWWLAALCEAT